MKQKIEQFSKNSGFTIIELLVVISIMGLFAVMVLVNFANLRVERSKKIARHELATNIRKVQSYSLNGRLSKTGAPVRFYIVKLTVDSSTYEIQSINNTAGSSTPPVTEETVRYPTGTPLKELWGTDPSGNESSTQCAQIVFALPFAKIYVDPSCNFQSMINDPSALLGAQDNKLHMMFDGQLPDPLGKLNPVSYPSVEVSGIVGSVSENIYTPPDGGSPPPPDCGGFQICEL